VSAELPKVELYLRMLVDSAGPPAGYETWGQAVMSAIHDKFADVIDTMILQEKFAVPVGGLSMEEAAENVRRFLTENVE
jgi:hypothetical protein